LFQGSGGQAKDSGALTEVSGGLTEGPMYPGGFWAMEIWLKDLGALLRALAGGWRLEAGGKKGLADGFIEI